LFSEDEKKESSDETKTANVNLDEKPVLTPHTNNEWSLVCSTVQEWNDLLSRFKNTRNKSEKILVKGLGELNAVMPEIFLEKVI